MIDIPTLIGYSAALFALIGGIFLLFWLKERESAHHLWFALPFLLGFGGAIFLMNPSIFPRLWDLRIGAWMILLAYAFAWQAVRAFYKRQVLIWTSVLPTVIWLALSALVFEQWNLPALSSGMRAIIVGLFNALAAYELRKDANEDLPSRRILFWVFVAYALFAVVRAPFTTALPAPLGASPTEAWAVMVFNFSVVTQALLVSAFMISMTRERVAMENYRMALRDPLTGVYNRRAFDQHLTGSAEPPSSPPTHAAVLLFDIDHFKRINDSFGHATGDEVIILAAQTAQKVLRKTDTLYRVGGEEFVCILPNTTGAEALEIAEHLRTSFQAAADGVGGRPVNATISIGISASNNGSLMLQALVTRADSALYRAKAKGRNCTILAESRYP